MPHLPRGRPAPAPPPFRRVDERWVSGAYVIEPVDATAPRHRRRWRLRRDDRTVAITVTVRMARLRAAEDRARG